MAYEPCQRQMLFRSRRLPRRRRRRRRLYIGASCTVHINRGAYRERAGSVCVESIMLWWKHFCVLFPKDTEGKRERKYTPAIYRSAPLRKREREREWGGGGLVMGLHVFQSLPFITRNNPKSFDIHTTNMYTLCK